MTLDHGQLRAVFVLIAHRPQSGMSAQVVATTLGLDLFAVQAGILDLAERGLVMNYGRAPWTYRTTTLIYDFNSEQAGGLFDEVYDGDR